MHVHGTSIRISRFQHNIHVDIIITHAMSPKLMPKAEFMPDYFFFLCSQKHVLTPGSAPELGWRKILWSHF